MPRLTFLMALTVTAAFAAAQHHSDDPFVGKWKLSLEKSKLTGQTIRIEEVAANKFKFQEDEHSDEIFADGLDHLTHFGDTMAITKKSDYLWAIVYKRNGAVTMKTLWNLSADGQSMTYTAEGTRPNGQHFKNQMVLKRVSGETSLAGKWEAVGVSLSSPAEIYIEPFAKDGHYIGFPDRKQTVRMKYDGKEYSESGPTVLDGSTSSGRRIDANTIETTEKLRGKVTEVAKATISADGKTQTIVVTEPGDPTPVVLVYEREK